MKPFLPILILISLLCCSNTTFQSDAITAKVIGIKDGDTIEILWEGKPQTVRLLDIDCPEKKQDFGNRAKQFTASFCFGKTVTLIGHKKDRYKRLLATVLVGDKNLNEALLNAGMAWHFVKYSNSKYYAALETTARNSRLGLWSQNNPTPPWEFRKRRNITTIYLKCQTFTEIYSKN